MTVLDHIRQAGAIVTEAGEPSTGPARPDAVVDIVVDEHRARFVVEAKRRAPYPGELANLAHLRATHAALGLPLFVAPYITEALGRLLVEAGWSWADGVGNIDLRAPGLRLRQRVAASPPPHGRSLPHGSGAWSIMRLLVEKGDVEGIGALAHDAGVTQPRASQVVGRLAREGLVTRIGRSGVRADREALLDRFLEEYPGPGGSERPFYALDDPLDTAIRLRAQGRRRGRLAVSADVGPDLVAPWRRPSLLIVYSDLSEDVGTHGLVPAHGRHDANVLHRVPLDHSVFPACPWTTLVGRTAVDLADPVQMLWDLQDLGGEDRQEAAEVLRTWLLERH